MSQAPKKGKKHDKKYGAKHDKKGKKDEKQVLVSQVDPKDLNQSARGTGRRKSQLEKDEIESLRTVFNFFDDDGNGTIEPEEIADKLAKFGLQLSTEEINDIMADVDENDDGVMDFDEFVKLMDRRMSLNSQRNEMRETFKVFDKDGDGLVSFKDLKATLLQLGEDVTDADVKDMIKQADLSGNGGIDFNEFVLMMSANESEETKNNLLGISA